ncbi:MAG: 2-dehydropantoate 2-reductase [Acetobacteraceae bacterium]|nr:2-dehydropantoate 2-reductase [Acetobacteraceae bacterium]
MPRIAIIGTGGIGAPLGASLAKAGAEVIFLARGAHLAAIRENGLRVEGDRGETLIRPALATDDPSHAGVMDYVLFCVKQWDVESAGAAIRPMIGPKTAVLPLQNGIDAAERLFPILGHDAVMGASALVTGSIIAPGVIRQTGAYQTITFGEWNTPSSARGERLRDLCAAAGFEGVLSPDIALAIWDKFVLLAPYGGVSALTRLPAGKWRDDPDVFALYEAALREVVAIGMARGVKFPADIVARKCAFVRTGFPPHHMASIGNDVVAGNRTELDFLSGKVIALGREHGIATPFHEFLYAALKLYRNGRPV